MAQLIAQGLQVQLMNQLVAHKDCDNTYTSYDIGRVFIKKAKTFEGQSALIQIAQLLRMPKQWDVSELSRNVSLLVTKDPDAAKAVIEYLQKT